MLRTQGPTACQWRRYYKQMLIDIALITLCSYTCQLASQRPRQWLCTCPIECSMECWMEHSREELMESSMGCSMECSVKCSIECWMGRSMEHSIECSKAHLIDPVPWPNGAAGIEQIHTAPAGHSCTSAAPCGAAPWGPNSAVTPTYNIQHYISPKVVKTLP